MATNSQGQDLSIILSEEYKQYLSALCKLSSRWVSRIRVQFANKAYNFYQDETIRKLVLAYGEEAEKREHERLREFTNAAEWLDAKDEYLEDSHCLIHDEEYAQALYFLFEIK